MAWIESHQSLLTHRKTGRASRSLGVSKITVIGHLHALWWWCLDNAQDGKLDDIDIEDVADGAYWEGDPAALIEGLVFAGFLDRDEGGLRVHHWMDYAGKLIEKRKSDAERKRNSRHAQDIQAPAQPVRRTSIGHPSDGAGTVPNPTQPNPTEEEDTPQSPKKETAPPGAARAKKPSAVYLSPPTLPQVKEFCLEQGWPELAEEALDFQSQRGWQMKSGYVTDWPAALRTWKRNRDRYAAENGARYPSRPSTPLVGGTLANAGHVQAKLPDGWKHITAEEAIRREKEYAAQVAARRQATAARNGS